MLTTKLMSNLLAFERDEGVNPLDWLTDHVVHLETLIEAGVTEALPALQVLKNHVNELVTLRSLKS